MDFHRNNPSIGLILCSDKGEAVAGYSVLSEGKQIFASKYLNILPTEQELQLEIEHGRWLIEEEQAKEQPAISAKKSTTIKNDFLDDPRPERVCDPTTARWCSSFYDPQSDDPEEIEGMIDLKAFLIFYCMCRQANKEYEKKRDPFPGRSLFNDLGWRPLLKAAISRTVNWFDKKKAVLAFHDEFASFTMK